MIDKNNPRVCVSAYPIGEDILQIGPTLCQAISDLGFSSVFVDNGSPAALESDILLLAGDGTCFDVFTKLLSNCGRNRPLTIFWLINPLPPPPVKPARSANRLKAAELRLAKTAPSLGEVNQGWFAPSSRNAKGGTLDVEP